MTSSSSMKLYSPGPPGSRMNRGITWAGMWITASAALGRTDGSVGRSDTTRHRARLTRCGKGCPGSIARGVTTGRSVLWKYASRTRVCSGVTSFGRTIRIPSATRRGWMSSRKHPVLLLDERVHALRHGRQRLSRGQPVGRGALVSRPDPLLQVRHPDHEELVQVRAEDRQELDALQQRKRRILGLLQHAAVEIEPRQLAVDHPVRHVPQPSSANVSRSSRASRTPCLQMVSP